jgi:hypothetical protein
MLKKENASLSARYPHAFSLWSPVASPLASQLAVSQLIAAVRKGTLIHTS